MTFTVPVALREPQNHSSDCYFCLTNIKRIIPKSKITVQYPDFPSAMQSVPHREELTLPAPPENLTFSDYHSDPDEGHGQRFDI
jgi:hypothetical protein